MFSGRWCEKILNIKDWKMPEWILMCHLGASICKNKFNYSFFMKAEWTLESRSSVEIPFVCVNKVCLHMMNSWLGSGSVPGEGWWSMQILFLWNLSLSWFLFEKFNSLICSEWRKHCSDMTKDSEYECRSLQTWELMSSTQTWCCSWTFGVQEQPSARKFLLNTCPLIALCWQDRNNRLLRSAVERRALQMHCSCLQGWGFKLQLSVLTVIGYNWWFILAGPTYSISL